jgi:hypothetical protein
MALARFFNRVYAAVGRSLSVDRESLTAILNNYLIVLKCGDHLVKIAQSINPAISIETDLKDRIVTVLIGNVADQQTDVIVPSAEGWVASLHAKVNTKISSLRNPYSSAVAAALAASEIFRKVFVDKIPEYDRRSDIDVSLLDYSSSTGSNIPLPDTSIGEVALVGIGAVGNSAIWALSQHLDLKGTLWLIDPENIELSNLQRYALAIDKDVTLKKTKIAERYLNEKTSLTLHQYDKNLESFADYMGNEFNIPTICISVDNIEGRRTAQALLPRLIINGWTSDSGLGASWHEFDSDAACLSCLYQPHGVAPSQIDLVVNAFGLDPGRTATLWISNQPLGNEELRKIANHLRIEEKSIRHWQGKPLSKLYTEVVCGSIGLDLEGVGKIEAVPLAHQSALAGVLMAAELIKRTNTELTKLSQTDCLIVWDNILSSPPLRWTQPRPREKLCICSDPVYQDIYKEKWS